MHLRARRRVRLVALSLALSMTVGSAATPPGPQKLSKAAAAAAIKEIDKDRSETERWLKEEPTSYLAAIDRRDFGTRTTLTVGRAADNDVRIDDPAVAAHHLRVAVEGPKFHVQGVDGAARFQLKDPKARPTREATLDPAYLEVGRFVLRLSHQGFPAIIVFDPKSPRFKEYKGLKYFPVDLTYRFELALSSNPHPETVDIMSTLGTRRRAQRVGWFEFMVDETPCRLEAVRLLEPGVGEQDIGLFFRDATTGKETYALGRYVDVKKLPNGKFLLDFNSAYNPACAFSDHYNCPVPPKANTLPVAIRAGEMDSHYH